MYARAFSTVFHSDLFVCARTATNSLFHDLSLSAVQFLGIQGKAVFYSANGIYENDKPQGFINSSLFLFRKYDIIEDKRIKIGTKEVFYGYQKNNRTKSQK